MKIIQFQICNEGETLAALTDEGNLYVRRVWPDEIEKNPKWTKIVNIKNSIDEHEMDKVKLK